LNEISNYAETKIHGKEKKDGGVKASSGIHPINALSVFAHTIAGHDHESVNTYESIMLGHSMENSMWYRIQPKIWDAVKLEFGTSAKRVQAMIEESKQWTLVADTGWSSRGWTAMHGSLPIIWYEQQLIVLHEVESKPITREGKTIIPGNYEGKFYILTITTCILFIGSSGGMEAAALRDCLKKLEGLGLLQFCQNIVMDKDSKSGKVIKELPECRHITIRYDPGHVKKSIVKQLLKVSLINCINVSM
jgi:hypothetical protein